MKLFLSLFLFIVFLGISGCSEKDLYTENSFVGKWKSSKLDSPIYLYSNGEWEIKRDSGLILQYGVWEYKGKNLVWSYKGDTGVIHDPNTILSVTPSEFKILEINKSVTLFSRLD